MRGNHVRSADTTAIERSIPACAGEPTTGYRTFTPPWVYPRVCGGTHDLVEYQGSAWGLSPRVRGNPPNRPRRNQPIGSIPACAGEPLPSDDKLIEQWVYPRVCGGTPRKSALPQGLVGLSPRVRGNPDKIPQRLAGAGSIPACAGEPSIQHHPAAGRRVYPRVCGGTSRQCAAGAGAEGLSPRVRGNRCFRRWSYSYSRSIPACAGEPRRRLCRVPKCRVYPRVCGGTRTRPDNQSEQTGLSPRVRGNPSLNATLQAQKGLSPRVRGNQGRFYNSFIGIRSIPACAGEPNAGLSSSMRKWVYPRVCGGTRFDAAVLRVGSGLSPRVRGNHRAERVRPIGFGSIPACAGEPPRGTSAAHRIWVYPRVCGGTSAEWEAANSKIGLSPRVRGNHCTPVGEHHRRRSIPACAGEP